MKLAEDLRRSVLQAAIEGKLTIQRSEDRTAEELLTAIRVEKERLIAEGRIKKENTLPPVIDDEIPFEVPDNWRWIRFGEVVNTVSARRVHQSDWQKSGVPFYRAREIVKLSEHGHVDNELYISEELFRQYSQSGIPSEGDIMITAVGTLGKSYVVRKTDRFYYKDASVICLENFAHLNPQYLNYILKSDMFMNQVVKNSSGTTVATLTIIRMNGYIFPLPPLDEQHRIVSRLDAILPKIDELEAAEKELEALKHNFPGDMRDAFLRAAIEGKLTGSNTENWQFVRLGDIGHFVRGHGIKKSEITETGKPCIRYGQLYTTFKTSFSRAVSFVPDTIFEKSVKVHKNDILMALTGENKVDIALAVAYMGDDEIAMGGDMTKFTHTIVPMYLVYFLNSPYAISYKSKLATGNIIVHISNDKLASIPVSLPSLEEQRRIVSRLNELLPLCEALEKII